MKTFASILLFVFISAIAHGQQCSCDTDESLNDVINCTPTYFENKAKLYWSFTCDSSWLTYEHRNKKEILFSMELVVLTGRLGFDYEREYKHVFLIRNNVISGCCSPPEYYLFDKETGREKSNLGRVLYIDTNKNQPIIIKITNSNYTDTINNYTSITEHNIDTDKKYLIPLSAKEIDKALKNTGEMHPEYLFEEPLVDGKTLTFKYRITQQGNQSRTIIIDLNKYL